MSSKIFEVRIVEVSNIPNSIAQTQIRSKVSEKGGDFARNWKGYAKVIYGTASPPKIISIEPIEGTPMDYYKGMDEMKPIF